ncbi:hypothetical protein D3C80_1788310 [compost metagenome]
MLDGLLAQAGVEHQPCLAPLLFAQRLAQGGAVDLFVDEAPAQGVDHDALGPAQRRVDEAPGRNPRQAIGHGTDA